MAFAVERNRFLNRWRMRASPQRVERVFEGRSPKRHSKFKIPRPVMRHEPTRSNPLCNRLERSYARHKQEIVIPNHSSQETPAESMAAV